MSNLIGRIVRAAKLDTSLYEEVEAEPEAAQQAVLVVVLSCLAAGLGGAVEGGIRWVIAGILGALTGWLIWAFLTCWIGTRLLPEPQTKADFGQLLRTLGFASAPGMIRVLGLIPGLGLLVSIVAAFWMLAAMVIAVRQALDYSSTWRALGVCFIGWVVLIVLQWVLVQMTGGPAV